ncbi:hypothetical protein [Sphingobium baderi]|uniref:hypothetical protein n=1 Tax=Sphingobium baderi TaxID=1332080 RepID=UPI002B403115|nr:hypothetical protein [Sphingobium baderi]WRD78901.1 hypothetical protein QQ987_19765 [Sphingobium baderi]
MEFLDRIFCPLRGAGGDLLQKIDVEGIDSDLATLFTMLIVVFTGLPGHVASGGFDATVTRAHEWSESSTGPTVAAGDCRLQPRSRWIGWLQLLCHLSKNHRFLHIQPGMMSASYPADS